MCVCEGERERLSESARQRERDTHTEGAEIEFTYTKEYQSVREMFKEFESRCQQMHTSPDLTKSGSLRWWSRVTIRTPLPTSCLKRFVSICVQKKKRNEPKNRTCQSNMQ